MAVGSRRSRRSRLVRRSARDLTDNAQAARVGATADQRSTSSASSTWFSTSDCSQASRSRHLYLNIRLASSTCIVSLETNRGHLLNTRQTASLPSRSDHPFHQHSLTLSS